MLSSDIHLLCALMSESMYHQQRPGSASTLVHSSQAQVSGVLHHPAPVSQPVQIYQSSTRMSFNQHVHSYQAPGVLAPPRLLRPAPNMLYAPVYVPAFGARSTQPEVPLSEAMQAGAPPEEPLSLRSTFPLPPALLQRMKEKTFGEARLEAFDVQNAGPDTAQGVEGTTLAGITEPTLQDQDNKIREDPDQAEDAVAAEMDNGDIQENTFGEARLEACDVQNAGPDTAQGAEGATLAGIAEPTLQDQENKIREDRDQAEDAVASEIDSRDCEVCQVEYHTDDLVSVLPCGHFFHSACIKRWLQAQGSERLPFNCPLCRANILQPPVVRRFEYLETRSRVEWMASWFPVTTIRTYRREVISGDVHVETHVERPRMYQGQVARIRQPYQVIIPRGSLLSWNRSEQAAVQNPSASSPSLSQPQNSPAPTVTLTEEQYHAMPGIVPADDRESSGVAEWL